MQRRRLSPWLSHSAPSESGGTGSICSRGGGLLRSCLQRRADAPVCSSARPRVRKHSSSRPRPCLAISSYRPSAHDVWLMCTAAATDVLVGRRQWRLRAVTAVASSVFVGGNVWTHGDRDPKGAAAGREPVVLASGLVDLPAIHEQRRRVAADSRRVIAARSSWRAHRLNSRMITGVVQLAKCWTEHCEWSKLDEGEGTIET